MEQRIKNDVEDATITLIQSGWSSVNNSPMIVCSLHTGKETYFINITDARSRKKKNADSVQKLH